MSINRWMDKEVVVHIYNGILLSRKKEHIWVSSNEVDEPRTYYTEWKWKKEKKVKSLSHVRLFVTSQTAAYQAPQSMGFSRQEYWSGLPFPSPGDLPDPGIEPRSPALQADALTSEPPGKPLIHNFFLKFHSFHVYLPFVYMICIHTYIYIRDVYTNDK